MTLTPERTVKGVIAAMVAAVAAATAVGFWLSYGGLHDFAVTAGMSGPEAWAWPASVDLFIIAGEAGVTISALRHRVDVMAWCYLALGFAASVTGNVLHVHPGELPWVKYAVAAVPPIAAMLALAALLRHVYTFAVKPEPVAVSDTVTVVTPVTESEQPRVDPVVMAGRASGAEPSVTTPVKLHPGRPEIERLADLTRGQQAKALDLTLRTLYRKIERGELPELAMANGNGKTHG